MQRKFYQVPTASLLAIAGIVWMIAGFNVARLGIIAYRNITIAWYHIVLMMMVFGLFGAMFRNIVIKHHRRVGNYSEPYRPFWNFFDIKSYIIMAIMMGGGIGLRQSGWIPDAGIAFFYTGLGIALFLAGIQFLLAWIKDRK